MIPLSALLNGIGDGYKLGKDRGKINHLLFMDDLKLYAKNEKELDTLVQTVRIFSEDIGMEFGIQKCAMVKVIRGHIVESPGIALPNGAEIRSLEKSEGYKYLGTLQSDDIKNKDMKQMTKNEYFRRVRKVLKASLN